MDKRKRPHSEEHKRKIGISNKGKKSPTTSGELNPAKRLEVRSLISAAMLGKKQTPEHTKKIASKNRGKIHSEEHKAKIRTGLRLALENGGWKGGISKSLAYKAFLQRKRGYQKRGNGGSHSLAEWETLKAQYNWTCPCCLKSEPLIKLTEDHIVPLSKGGSNNIENIQPLCSSCNSRKKAQVIVYAKPV